MQSKIIMIISAVVLFVSAVIFLGYKHKQISDKQEELNKSIVLFQQLKDDIARSQSQVVMKHDLEDFIINNNANLDEIKKNINSLNANLTGVNRVVINSNGYNQTNLPSTNTNKSPDSHPITAICNGEEINCKDIYGYNSNKQNLLLSEKFGNLNVPFGEVGFSAWRDKPWDLTVYPRSYKLINVLATDENNRHFIYNKFSINSNNKEYSISIDQAEFLEQYPDPHFNFWNPKLFLGGLFGIKTPIQGEVSPNISLQIMSYGKTKINPDLSILQIGVGYGLNSNVPIVQINPVNFNIGKSIPGNVIANTYVGPSIGFSVRDVIGGINIGVGF